VNILLALRFYGVGDIRVENIPNPICNPKEALVKVKYAGIQEYVVQIFIYLEKVCLLNSLQ
jgi:threonine dehydrogenase-like Zn-dependent dehydrogenase